jgi:polyhydroxybutyrate depolymerase
MHGAGGNGLNMEKLTLYSDLADADGFIAVYPDGLNGIWNDGRAGDSRVPSDLDDVGFISTMIDALAEQFNVDTSRVFATGYSMGGMMAFRLGCELQDKIAAVASVASTFPGYLLQSCDSAMPVPVLVVQGTEDDVIPWDGIRRGNFIIYLSTAETAVYWAAHNGCTPDPEVVEGLDLAAKDGTLVRQVFYTDCNNNSDVMIYAIAGGGHTWPGSKVTATWGITSFDLYASPAIWQFFEGHTLKK